MGHAELPTLTAYSPRRKLRGPSTSTALARIMFNMLYCPCVVVSIVYRCTPKPQKFQGLAFNSLQILFASLIPLTENSSHVVPSVRCRIFFLPATCWALGMLYSLAISILCCPVCVVVEPIISPFVLVSTPFKLYFTFILLVLCLVSC